MGRTGAEPIRGVRLFFLALVTCALFGCPGSEKRDRERAEARLWGRERLAAEIEKKAKETIDADQLEASSELRERVFSMSFEEVVARLGFVEYSGVAKFDLQTASRTFSVAEDTLIQHGLHGSFRVLQRDAEGDVTREVIFNNGVYFVRNGGGEMRVQGIVKDQHLAVRDEAWQPLRVYTAYFGPRAGLKKVGSTTAEGRALTRYKLVLLDGPELVTVKGVEGAKKPISLSGEILVDQVTGVPAKSSLRGALDVPSSKGEPAGRLSLSLDASLKTIPGDEIKPKSFIPTITRHPVDLAPLSFLDGGTRTSTVIGGKKPAFLRPPDDLENAEQTHTTTSAPSPSKPPKKPKP